MGSISGETLPKRNFVESFRIVCWQFLVYQEALENIPPFYDECPSYCYKWPKRKDKDNFCDHCEVGVAKQAFEDETEKILKERLDNKWKKYGLQSLISQVKNTFEIKESKEHNENLSIIALIMVNILRSEENRQDRIRRYNDKLEREKNK